jgi:tetratricopeptide (TPR) repeat protein
VCKNKDPRDFNFLLSIAASNVVEEVKIMTNLKKDRAPSLHLYASTMWARYQVSGEHKYLESSIQYWHKALEVDPRHADAMADLASALWMRYARFQQVQDLNEVIILYRALLFSQLSNNPGYSNWLNAIGLALWDRYKRTKQMNDMDHAISYFRQASLSYPYPCDAGTLSNLGNILMAKARAFKDTSESDEAISCYRRALESVSALYEHRSALLCNLGDALSYRYDRRCLIADLNEAIRSYERALDLPSPHHRDRVTQLLVFSQRLQARYNSTADSEDLENAIKRLSEAKRLASPSHPKYAAVVETLVLAQRDYDTLRRSRPDYASPPPSTAASPTLDNSHIPTLRPTSWDTPGPSATSAHIPGVTSVAPSGPPPSYRSSPKTFRIVGRSHTMKPYNRPTSNARGDSSASDDSESSSSRAGPRFLPHPVHASVARAKSPQYHRVGGPPPRRATMPVNGHGHALP